MNNLAFVHVDPQVPQKGGLSRVRRPVFGEPFVLDGGPCLLIADDEDRLMTIPADDCRPCLGIEGCRFCLESCTHPTWVAVYVKFKPGDAVWSQKCRSCGLQRPRVMEVP